jgi:leader peptidase (prepilin peptidase)/N-methyltransferase
MALASSMPPTLSPQVNRPNNPISIYVNLMASWWSEFAMIESAIIAFLCGVALVIAVADYCKMIIPDGINAALAGAGVYVSVFAFQQDWRWVIWSAVAVFLIFTGFAQIYQRARGVSGLGMGDIKFLTAASTWVGFTGLPWLLLFACIGGLAHVLARHFTGYEVARATRIPFGPYLSMALVLVWSLKLAI